MCVISISQAITVQHLTLTVNIGDHTLQWHRLNLQGKTNVGLILSTARHIGGAGHVRQTTVVGNDKISLDHLQRSRHQAAIQETLRLGLRRSGRWQTREGKEFLQLVHLYIITHVRFEFLPKSCTQFSLFWNATPCRLTDTVSVYKMCSAKRHNTSPVSYMYHSHNIRTVEKSFFNVK